ncbi:MAG TPA: sigma-70 family RNA polymerase sigma factor [Gaiellaceae bacterium]|nr:sigma-70 family RNA polymerase sigma factor [Gaiellaceae bacterium]
MSADLPTATLQDRDDAELVRRTTRGELSAFEQLVDRHRPVVVRVAARIVGSADAEDVSQDAFLRAFHRVDRFRGDAPFRTWLLRIAHNAALDHLRRRRAEPVDPETLDTSEESPSRPPAEQLEMRERTERLERKLHGLSPQHRVVLVLRDAEGLSYEEIADITDSPLGSVKGRLHRARQEFVEMLRANTYDWELPQ